MTKASYKQNIEFGVPGSRGLESGAIMVGSMAAGGRGTGEVTESSHRLHKPKVHPASDNSSDISPKLFQTLPLSVD